MDEYKLILEYLRRQPKEVIQLIIFELMKSGDISFADIAQMHVRHLEELEKGATDELMQLRGKVISLWCGTKKELPKSLVALMQEAKDNGWANVSQDQIDNSKWNKSTTHP